MDVRSVVVSWPEEAPRGAVVRFGREHGVSTSWFYEVRARARTEPALSALQPRSRSAPSPHPQAVSAVLEELAVRIRKELADDGWDHGPVTVRAKLLKLGLEAPAASTLNRIFVRHGMVTPQPQKRPHSADRRFEAALVDELWQLDAYEWHLADGSRCAVFNLLDDCSRTLRSSAAPGETAEAAVAVTAQAIEQWQPPSLFLTDNGSALNPSRRGRPGRLTQFLTTLGCRPITGRPDHPQTQGKDERVHQTQQRWLRARPTPETLADLQALLDAFDAHYNTQRPHQSLGMLTPDQARATRPRAVPPIPPAPAPVADRTPARIKVRKVDTGGNLVLRPNRPDHLTATVRMDPEHHGTTVSVMVTDQTITIFDARGHHIRTVHLEPGKRYYSNGRPRGGWGRRPRPNRPD
jgi:transposase InsO family protein